MRSKAHENLHHLGFQASGSGGSHHAVERRLDAMELADMEAVLQGFQPFVNRTSRFYSSELGRVLPALDSPAPAEHTSIEVEMHALAAEGAHPEHAVDTRRVSVGHPVECPG